MGVITIPRAIREKLGEEATDAFVELLKQIDLDARKDAIAIAEERFERRLAEEAGKLKIEIEKVRTELKIEIERNRADILKWMFIFWIGQIGALSGIIILVLKLYLT